MNSSRASAACSSIRTGSPGAPLPKNSGLPMIRRSGFTPRWRRCSAKRATAKRLGVLNAHPDLAGKLAQAKRLTESSTSEQASAGLDALTDAERERFTDLNSRYVKTFGFPLHHRRQRSHARTISWRLSSGASATTGRREFDTACRQVERIALLRLTDMLAA